MLIFPTDKVVIILWLPTLVTSAIRSIAYDESDRLLAGLAANVTVGLVVEPAIDHEEGIRRLWVGSTS